METNMFLTVFFLLIGLNVFINTTNANSCNSPPFNGDLEQSQDVQLFWKDSKITIRGVDDYSVLAAEDVKVPPHLTISSLDPGLYVVLMEDPDAPYPNSTQDDSPFQHFMKINTPHNQLDGGDVVLSYMGPSPPRDSSPHRYFIVVYKQPSHKDSQRDVPAGTEEHAKRTSKNALKKLGVNYGEPVAWACFKATSNPNNTVAPTPPPEITKEMKDMASVKPGSKEEADIKKKMDECKEKPSPSCPKIPGQEESTQAELSPHNF